jgi:hypothetical protein
MSFFAAKVCNQLTFLSLQYSAEKLLADLASRNRATVGPLLVSLLQQSATADLPLATKEAVYSSMGLCANDLFDYLDFNVWFAERLLPACQNSDSSNALIRRRVAILLGQWVSVSLSSASRSQVYPFLVHLVAQDPDLVVRLAAVNSLRLCIDDFDFELGPYLPHTGSTVSACMSLLQATTEFESKLLVINALVVVVERVGEQIKPVAGQILQALSELWVESEGEHMFQSAILTILTKIVAVSFTLH